MAHDPIDTTVRSRKLNEVTATVINQTEPNNKPNDNVFVSSSTISHKSCPDDRTEVKHTIKNDVHITTNNNYQNGRMEVETRKENAIANDTTPTDTTDNRLSCLRGSLLHDNVPFIPQFRWPDLIVQIFLHIGAAYGLLFQFYSIKFYTLIWCKLIDVSFINSSQ